MFASGDLGYVNLHGSARKSKKTEKKSKFVDGLLLWWGVLIPVAALILEATTHFCARHFFDPLPTSWHGLFFALIPFTNFLAWCSLRFDMSPHYAFMFFCNGMAAGVAILYTLMFLPITHISFAAVFLFGFGLLGLAPLLSLISLMKGDSIVSRQSMAKTYFNAHHVKHIGHLVVLAAVIAVETPSTFTRIALGMAAKPESRQQGLDLLRAFGNQEVMLRACYERSGRATDIVGSLYESHEPLPISTARELFYRVTGRTFNSFPIPESARATMRHAGFIKDDGISGAADDEFDLDPDIAGEMVSGVSRGLSVCKSEMNGEVDADAGVAQFDWYLNFNNKSKFDREVRTRIRLPRGAVVNGASLIVDGQEYNATITVKSLAREVYRAAVAEKKNPLLVSTCGADTVLVQAFPVPPGNSKEVKLHLRVASPVQLDCNNQAVIVLPQFEERNFQVSTPYEVTIKSKGNLTADIQGLRQNMDGQQFVLQGTLDPAALATGSGIIRATRQTDVSEFYTKDTFGGGSRTVVEKIEATRAASPSNLVAVIDGSAIMGGHLNAIADAFQYLPPDMTLSVWYVLDDGSAYLSGSKEEVISALKKFHCVGGQLDDVALYNALVRQSSNSAVLWIHGAQPLESPYQPAITALFNGGAGVPLYNMQIVSGPNQLLDTLEVSPKVIPVSHIGKPEDDLKFLFDQWANRTSTNKFIRSVAEASAPAPLPAVAPSAPALASPAQTRKIGELEYSSFNEVPTCVSAAEAIHGKPTMPALAQLTAYDKIVADMLKGDEASKQDAIELASRYQIVTPMSSAILVKDVPELTASHPECSEKRSGSGISSMPRRVVQHSFDKVTANLNRLNAVTADGAGAGSMRQRNANECERKPAAESSQSARLVESKSELPQAAYGGRYALKEELSPRSEPVNSQVAASNAPIMHGATAGAIGPQGADCMTINSPAELDSLSSAKVLKKQDSVNDFKMPTPGILGKTKQAAAAPACAPCPVREVPEKGANSSNIKDSVGFASKATDEVVADGRESNKDTGLLDADSPQAGQSADQEPLVPEADTYLLIAIAAGALGLVIWSGRKKALKA